MKQVKRIFKLIFLIYIVYVMGSQNVISIEEDIVLLSLIIVNIIKEKYYDNCYMIFISFIIIIIGIQINVNFGVLLSMTVFDYIYNKTSFLGGLPYCHLAEAIVMEAFQVYFLRNSEKLPMLILLTAVCGLFGYIAGISEYKEQNYQKSLDEERALRYELDEFKRKLLNSSKEVAYLAELRERNRIAREIHDTVGHSATGILIQLQAAYRLFGRDDEKAKGIVEICVNALSDMVTLLRDTVHNIKPNEKLGVEYIQNIIKQFSFCYVKFKFSGDFNSLSPSVLEIIGTNIKEALTNASKYSKASEISISIDINEICTRLYIKDNGVGCSKIKEGMGLGGMRERIENLGGSLSVGSQDGFLIVCIIPRKDNGEN